MVADIVRPLPRALMHAVNAAHRESVCVWTLRSARARNERRLPCFEADGATSKICERVVAGAVDVVERIVVYVANQVWIKIDIRLTCTHIL